MDALEAELSLVFRVHARLCALPLGPVLETMRPLPTEPVAGAPHFVQGVAVIRGAPVPVIAASRLLDGTDAPARRFVTLTLGTRVVALAVGDVLGVHAIARDSLRALPPLLQQAGSETVAALALLDAELLWVLQSPRLLSDEVWQALMPPRAAA